MDVKFPYEQFALREELKELAGVRWEPQRKAWEVSRDLIKDVCSLAVKHDMNVLNKVTWELDAPPSELPIPDSRLYDFQKEAVIRAVNQRKLMLNFEMGLGKTPTAIDVLRNTKPKRVLIICPAMVRLVWVDELKKWWPEHPQVQVIEMLKEVPSLIEFKEGIAIASYNALSRKVYEGNSELLDFPFNNWDAIIFDESHYAKEPDSERSKACLILTQRNPNAIVLLLTATPITSEPKDLWHQLHLMYPGRFGTKWQFYKRYAHTAEGQYGGMEVWGVRDETVQELRDRIAPVSVRVTKKEVAHLLPPYSVQMVRVRSEDRIRFKELLEEFQGTDLHNQYLDNFLAKAGPLKIPIAIKHVKESLDEGSTHMMVLTHFRETAKALAEELQSLKDVAVFHYDGSVTAPERHRITKEASSAKRAVICSTMHAVKEGIDLTKFTDSIAAELYWQPATIIQLLGRYHRLSSKVAARFRFLVLAGSLDEIIAKVLKRRITDASKIIESGVSDDKFLEAFNGSKRSDAEILEELRLVAKRRVAFDEYT